MATLLDRLETKVRKEIRYARGMRCMHRERYLEYCADLGAAHQRGDAKRAREIADDLRAFAGEMQTLIARERAAYDRLVHLHTRQGFTKRSTAGPDNLGASWHDAEPDSME